MRPLTILALFAALLTLTDCAAGGAATRKDYHSQVERAYAKAEKAMQRNDYVDAVSRYNAIRSQYPYSRFATLAELRLGDAYYGQEKFATAITEYRTFIKLHPNHPKVVYASYRIAESFYGQMPKDYFMVPPSYERQLGSAHDAEREFEYFLRKYPDSKYSAKARKKLALVKRRLADHEMYVAKFYLKRDNPRACAMRLTYLLDHYSGVGLDADALYLLARSYLQLGDVHKAATALNDLIRNFPNNSLAKDARHYLAKHPLAEK